jgi:hypothetical protein
MTRILLLIAVTLAFVPGVAQAATDGTSNTLQLGAAVAKPTQALHSGLMEEEGLSFPGR